MRLNRVALLLLVGALATSVASLTHAAVLLDENFDDDAVGSIPGSVDVALGADGPGSDMEVVGPGSSYADPFGPAGNHSFIFDNFNGGSANPNVWPFAVWNNELGQPSNTYREGTVEFDLYLNNDVVNGVDQKFWTYVDLRLGFDTTFPNTAGDTIVYGNFRIQDGVGYYFFDNAFGPSNGHPIVPDKAQHVKYTILSNETYTLQIDGSYVEKDGSKFVPWRVTGPDKGFDVLAIGSAWGPNFLTNNPFYLDNLKVTATPEPGALGLGAAAAATIAAVHRRRRR